jgi:hypothetical protein
LTAPKPSNKRAGQNREGIVEGRKKEQKSEGKEFKKWLEVDRRKKCSSRIV